MKSKLFLCFRPIVEDSVHQNHAIDQSTSSIITKRSDKHDQLFESKSSRGNRRDKFFKPLLDGTSRKLGKMILKGNSNKQKEITSIGTLSKGNQPSRKIAYNQREATRSTSTSCDENKKSSTNIHLIAFTLFVTIYFGRVYAIFLTLLWILLFSIMPKPVCRTVEKLFLAGCCVEKTKV
ncbi:uncharacterized protein LOC129871313 [Solanum dulcamara]|uniref:uncharacterized protein LOC129871313 n=1 Tax=Solanum dulcamara TaxID=45834 RepID=UPI002486A3E5|nr:uncharacterized protein LOC129871313 [Solanum dulcamara]